MIPDWTKQMTIDGIFKLATGKTAEEWFQSGDLDWFEGYADGRGDGAKGVLVADWNHFPRTAAAAWPRTAESEAAQEFNWNKGRKFQDILERFGYDLDWSDQIGRCDDCNKAIRETPDSYCDMAHSAIIGECAQVCADCIRKNCAAEYLEGLEDNFNTAVAISGIDPTEHGYTLIKDGFESGFHRGQNDNPRTIGKRLHEQGYQRIIFKIDSTGQFDTRFSVYYRDTGENE